MARLLSFLLVLCFLRGSVFPLERLHQVRHPADDGTGDRARPGEEDGHEEPDWSWSNVARMWRVWAGRRSKRVHGRITSEEPGRGTGQRTKQRANHETFPKKGTFCLV
jgi:hypothetical protein